MCGLTEPSHGDFSMRNYLGDLNLYPKLLLVLLLGPFVALLLVFELGFEFGLALLSVPIRLIFRGRPGFKDQLRKRFAKSGPLMLWHQGTATIRDLGKKKRRTMGTVGRKWSDREGIALVPHIASFGNDGPEYHRITVDGQTFMISESVYHWVSSGDHVVVHYWPESKIVSRVEKVISD